MAGNSFDIIVNMLLKTTGVMNSLSQIESQVKSSSTNVSSSFNNINNSSSNVGTGLKSAFDRGLNGVADKVYTISSRFQGLNGVMGQVMGLAGVGSFKSLTLDMAMAREQAKNLLTVTMQGEQSWADAQVTAGKFLDTIKEGTDSSVIRFQTMIEAMNGVKLSTGMTNEELEKSRAIVQKIGEAAILMGDNEQHATFVMKESMAGLNGDFRVLKEQFGITKEKMLATNLWSGSAKDVDGYTKALDQCLKGMGNLSQVTDTTTGRVTKVGSIFRSAGLSIGQKFTPFIDKAADWFIKANENGKVLASTLVWVGGAASILVSIAPTLAPMMDTFRDMKDIYGDAKDAINLLTDAEKIQTTVCGALDGATALLTGTKIEETVAEEASTVAKVEDTVATEGETVAHITLAGALQACAVSAWELTTTLLMSPYFWLAVAIVAVVAVLWNLYNTNEEVHKSIDGIISVIKGGLTSAWNAIVSVATTVYNAFVKLGQTIYNLLVPAWNQIGSSLNPLITAFHKLWNSINNLCNQFMSSIGVTQAAGGLWGVLASIGQVLGGVIVVLVRAIALLVQGAFAILIPIVTGVVNYFIIFANTMTKIIQVVNMFRGGQISIGQAFQMILGLLHDGGKQVGDLFSQMAKDIWNNFVGIFNSLPGTVQNGLNSLPGIIWNFITQIPGLLYQGLSTILYALGYGLGLLVRTFTEWLPKLILVAGGGMLLLGKMLIDKGVPAIIAFGQSAYTAMSTAIGNMINGAKETIPRLPEIIWNGLQSVGQYLSQLPGIMWQELERIGGYISNAGGMILSAIWGLGESIVQGFLDAMGIHSPGHMANAIRDELSRIGEFISGAVGVIVDAVVQLAQNIVTAFIDGISMFSPGLATFITDVLNIFSELVSSVFSIFERFGEGEIDISGVVQSLYGVYTNAFSELETVVGELMGTMWSNILSNLNTIVPGLGDSLGGLVNSIISGVTAIRDGFMAIPNIILNSLTQGVMFAGLLVENIRSTIILRFNMLVSGVRMVFTNIVNAIRIRLSNARNIAGTLASLIRTVITTRLNLIIARVRQIFQNIVNTIRSRLVSAVSSARQKAKEIYDGIVQKIQELPGKVGTEISNLATTIKDKLVQAGVNAFEGAKHLVAQFLAGMGIHSPGFIQRATRTEFSTLPEIITNSGVESVKAIKNMSKNIVQTWDDNMGDGLSIPPVNSKEITDSLQRLTIPISQFEAFNNRSMNSLRNVPLKSVYNSGNIPSMVNNSSSSVNNDDHKIIYNIQGDLVFDCNNLEGNTKELFYRMLNEIKPGGVM